MLHYKLRTKSVTSVPQVLELHLTGSGYVNALVHLAVYHVRDGSTGATSLPGVTTLDV